MAWCELINGWQMSEGEGGSTATRVFVERDDGTVTLPAYQDEHPNNDSLVVTGITTSYVGEDYDRQKKEIKYGPKPSVVNAGSSEVEGNDDGARRDARMSGEVFSYKVDPGQGSDAWYWYKSGTGQAPDPGPPFDIRDGLQGDIEAYVRIATITESIPLIIRDYAALRSTAIASLFAVNNEHLDAAFLNAQSETVMFTGYSANAFYNPSAKVRWDVRLNFETRIVTRTAGEWVAGSISKDGWNYEWFPGSTDGGAARWDRRTNNNGDALYERVNMAPLLALQ